MGIHDRGYYREEPGRGGFGSGGRPGGYRFRGFSAWSVTTWLIVINVAVFVFDAFMAKNGLPVYNGTPARMVIKQLPPAEDRAEGREFFAFDQSGNLVETTNREVNRLLYRAVVHEETREIHGWNEYRVMYPLEAIGHFSTYQGFQRLKVWRLVTFQFLHHHRSIWHIAINMFMLWMFGSLVEEQLGRRKYLAFYLVSGVFGGVMYLLLNLAGAGFGIELPGVLFGETTVPLVGASAGVFGVIMACAYIAPSMPVYMIFIPIPLKMKWVAYGMLAIAVFNLLAAGSNAGGDAAHVGGALAGAYFIRNSHLLLDFFDVFKDSRPRRGGKKPRAPRTKPPKPSADANRRAREEAEIDAILAKVKDEGIASLTAKEKKLLAKDTERRRGEG